MHAATKKHIYTRICAQVITYKFLRMPQIHPRAQVAIAYILFSLSAGAAIGATASLFQPGTAPFILSWFGFSFVTIASASDQLAAGLKEIQFLSRPK